MIGTFLIIYLFENETVVYVSMTVVQESSTMSQEKLSQNLKRENGQPSEPVPKRKKVDFTRFECLLLKFPPLGEAIFDNLDDQSVAKCAEVNEILQKVIYKDKFYWTRQIRSFFGTSNVFKNDWETMY